MQRYKKKLLITNKWRRFFCFGRHWYGMELVSAIMANNHYAIANILIVFGFTSGKGDKFGLGHKKTLFIIVSGLDGVCYLSISSVSQASLDLIQSAAILHLCGHLRGREHLVF